jgi:hypothetical protein
MDEFSFVTSQDSLTRLQQGWHYVLHGSDSSGNWDLEFKDLAHAVSFATMFRDEDAWFTFPDRVTQLHNQAVTITLAKNAQFKND